jgi:hypothetical protein
MADTIKTTTAPETKASVALAIVAALVAAGCNTAPVDPMTAYRLKDPGDAAKLSPAPAFDPAMPGPQAAGATYVPTPAVPFAPPMISCMTLPPSGEGNPAITDCGP